MIYSVSFYANGDNKHLLIASLKSGDFRENYKLSVVRPPTRLPKVTKHVAVEQLRTLSILIAMYTVWEKIFICQIMAHANWSNTLQNFNQASGKTIVDYLYSPNKLISDLIDSKDFKSIRFDVPWNVRKNLVTLALVTTRLNRWIDQILSEWFINCPVEAAQERAVVWGQSFFNLHG